jgi:hypothetical protein
VRQQSPRTKENAEHDHWEIVASCGTQPFLRMNDISPKWFPCRVQEGLMAVAKTNLASKHAIEAQPSLTQLPQMIQASQSAKMKLGEQDIRDFDVTRQLNISAAANL